MQITCASGIDGAAPLKRLPPPEIVTLEGLFKQCYAIGMKQKEAVRNINGGMRIRDMIRGGRATLEFDHAVGSKFTLTFHDTQEVALDKTNGPMLLLPGTYELDMNHSFTRCSCMKRILRGSVRDQNNWWCPHKCGLILNFHWDVRPLVQKWQPHVKTTTQHAIELAIANGARGESLGNKAHTKTPGCASWPQQNEKIAQQEGQIFHTYSSVISS